MNSQKRFIPLALVAFFVFLSSSSCNPGSLTSSETEFLKRQTKEHPPQSDGLTAYASRTPYGGRVFCIAKQGTVLFAGTTNGIHRSTNTGKSWERVRSTIGGLKISDVGEVSDMAIVGNTMFVRLSMTRPSIRKTSELYRSSDGGATLVPIEEPADGVLQSLRSGNDSLFVTTRLEDGTSELYRTNNLGSNWQRMEVSIPKAKVFVGTTVGDVMVVGTSTGTYQSMDRGRTWNALYDLLGKPVLGDIFNVDNTLFALELTSVPYGLVRSRIPHIYRLESHQKSWTPVGGAPSLESVNVISAVGDTLIAGTDNGIYYKKEDDSEAWKDASTELRIRSTRHLVAVNGRRFVIVEEDPGFSSYRPSRVCRSDDDGETWQVVGDIIGNDHIFAFTAIDTLLFIGGSAGVYRSDDFGVSWQRAGLGDNIEDQRLSFPVTHLISIGNTLFAVKYGVFRSVDRGLTWKSLTDGLSGKSVNSLVAIDNSVFAATSEGLFRLDEQRNVWVSVIRGSIGEVKLPAVAGKDLFAGASGSNNSPVINLLRVETSADHPSWKRLRGDNLSGELLSVYVDQDYPSVMLVGTNEGLFWSTDGGDVFQKLIQKGNSILFERVDSIDRVGRQLFVGTDAGLFFIYDQVPRGNWYAHLSEWVKQHPWLFSGAALVVLLMIFLSTRLISLLLQLDLWGLNQIAPTFYLLPFGRWKLFRRYRETLRNDPDLKYSSEHYVDLPFVSDDPAGGSLSDTLRRLARTKRVVVIADGGRGKSTLCHYLVMNCIERRGFFGDKILEPVMIDGLSYAGDLLNTITSALREDRAYVNRAIADSQTAVGNLLVIFDGFSEIKETFIGAASASDLPEFIRQHPDTPFIFTTRSNLPIAVQQALKDVLTIRLCDVDETTVRSFLTQYLKRGASEVDALLREIEMRFNDLPRIPLMLKLVCTVYDKKGKVPKDTASLFAEYAEQVLRPEATGIDEPIGLNYAICHLVRETFLTSGGDRGLTVDQGVQLLENIEDRLESYDIKLSPIKMLHVLTRAGLYRRVGGTLKFFHDSFESYFGARALESDFREGRYQLLSKCAVNERLSETWRFLNEILADSGDAQKLEILIREAAWTSADTGRFLH
jgi:photosystem II stability/assembly factor-like uncharacterized protein